MTHTIQYTILSFCLLFGMSACVQTRPEQELRSKSLREAHEPHTLLQDYLAFSEKDLLAMEEGKVVVKTFDSEDIKNEVAAFGAMKMNVSKELYLEQFRDIVNFTKSPEIKAIAKFNDPPGLEDLAGLRLVTQDLKALRSCRPKACKVKIDDETMQRFQQDVDWKAPEAQSQAENLMRQFMLDYLKGYLEHGDSALGEYHDKNQPLRIADAFGELLENSAFLFEYAPELHKYLKDFPKGALADVEDFFYWSEEQYGLKPVLNLFHITIYQRKQDDSNDIFITSKQIYASHYFESSLGFTAFVDERGGQDHANSYLMYLNRSRFDQLRGPLKKMIISLTKGRVYNGIKHYFRTVKERLEAARVVSNN